MKKWLLCIATLSLILGCTELLSSVGLFILKKRYNIRYEPVDTISSRHIGIINKLLHDKSSYIKFSPELGWTIREFGKTNLYTANFAGMRSTKEYELNPPTGKLRIMVCGDGFVHCNDVKNEEAWPALLNEKNVDWEVLNFGVWGYALDQSYLRYLKKSKQYKSHIVLIGFGSDNIFRLVNTYRPFLFRHTGLPFTKPRFRIKNGMLELVPNPLHRLDDYQDLLDRPKKSLSRIGIDDYYYKHRQKSHMFDKSQTIKLFKIGLDKMSKDYDEALVNEAEYNKISEILELAVQLFDKFHERITENRSIPVFCIFPGKHDIRRYRAFGTKRYSSLLDHFETNGYQYIDAMNAFDGLGKDFNLNDLYEHFYSTLGNKYVSKCIYESLIKISNKANEQEVHFHHKKINHEIYFK